MSARQGFFDPELLPVGLFDPAVRPGVFDQDVLAMAAVTAAAIRPRAVTVLQAINRSATQ